MVEMKKVWSRPLTVVQNFEANEYVAACWKIKCNVPSGTGYYETNGIGGFQGRTGWHKIDGDWVNVTSIDDPIASGSGCGEYHIGVQSDSGPVENAMWQEWNGDYYPVFYFSTGRGNNDQHFAKIASAEWETNPNAS